MIRSTILSWYIHRIKYSSGWRWWSSVGANSSSVGRPLCNYLFYRRYRPRRISCSPAVSSSGISNPPRRHPRVGRSAVCTVYVFAIDLTAVIYCCRCCYYYYYNEIAASCPVAVTTAAIKTAATQRRHTRTVVLVAGSGLVRYTSLCCYVLVLTYAVRFQKLWQRWWGWVSFGAKKTC